MTVTQMTALFFLKERAGLCLAAVCVLFLVPGSSVGMTFVNERPFSNASRARFEIWATSCFSAMIYEYTLQDLSGRMS